MSIKQLLENRESARIQAMAKRSSNSANPFGISRYETLYIKQLKLRMAKAIRF